LIGSVAIVRAASPPRAATLEDSTNSKVHAIVHEMAEGMRFILHHAAISFVVMAMAAGMFVMGCFGPLIAIYVRDRLHATAFMFGIVSAMVGIGMILGMPAVRRLSGTVASTTLVLGGLSGIGLGALLLGGFTLVPTAMLGCFTIGFTFAGVIVPAQTLMQRETPPALIGRISSSMMSIVFFAQVTGLLLSGFLAQHLGIRAVFLLCAVLAWVLTGAGKLLLGTERHAAATV
jgi:DHA3 family macrolide efflux protein-like MFS transporter